MRKSLLRIDSAARYHHLHTNFSVAESAQQQLTADFSAVAAARNGDVSAGRQLCVSVRNPSSPTDRLYVLNR